jgi:hypothetical protein
MRADIHDGPEQMLQSKAGYIDARPLTASSAKPLATHGRTIQLGQTRLFWHVRDMSGYSGISDMVRVAPAAAEHDADEWQAAMQALLLVAELNGPPMLARIGVMRALNRNVERVFDPSRKDHHWGRRRKLARDR